VRGEAFASTQRVDNLLATETRLAPTKRGSVKFGVGVADVETPGFGARGSAFSLGLQYATPRFSLPVDIRFAFGSGEYTDAQVSMFSVGVGGRAFLSKRDVSPFLGAGLGMLWLSADEGSPEGSYGSDFYDDQLLVAPYLEAGVEALRLHRGRVALLVRVDLPLSSLEREGYTYSDGYDPRSGAPTGREIVVPAESHYVAPVWIGVHVAF
jgi:hypothetical protein